MAVRMLFNIALALVLSLTIFFSLSQNATHLAQAEWTPAHPTKEYSFLHGRTFYGFDLNKVVTTLTQSYTKSLLDRDNRKNGFYKRALSWEKAVERGEAALCFMDQTIPALTDRMRTSGKLIGQSSESQWTDFTSLEDNGWIKNSQDLPTLFSDSGADNSELVKALDALHIPRDDQANKRITCLHDRDGTTQIEPAKGSHFKVGTRDYGLRMLN